MRHRNLWVVTLIVAVTCAFSMNAQYREDRHDVAQRVAERIFLGPRVDLPDGLQPFALDTDATAASGRRRAVRHPSPATPLTGITYFLDANGAHAGFVASFPVPSGTVMAHFYVTRDKNGNITRTEIPPRTTVTAENGGRGWAGWFFGGRTWGTPLPEGTIAFEVEYSGTLNFVVSHGVEPGSGPLQEATVYPDSRIFLEFKPGHFGYDPAAFVLGYNVPVEPGSWITPPDGGDYHGPNVPVSVCVGFARVDCSTRLRDIPTAPGN